MPRREGAGTGPAPTTIPELTPPEAACLVLHHVLLRFQARAERLLEVVHLRLGRLLRARGLLLGRLLVRRAAAHPSAHRARRGADRGALTRVARDPADERPARRTPGGAPRARAGGGRRALRCRRLRLLARGLRLLLELEGVGAGVLHRPLVALPLVLRLLRRGLPRVGKRIDADRGRQRLLLLG